MSVYPQYQMAATNMPSGFMSQTMQQTKLQTMQQTMSQTVPQTYSIQALVAAMTGGLKARSTVPAVPAAPSAPYAYPAYGNQVYAQPGTLIKYPIKAQTKLRNQQMPVAKVKPVTQPSKSSTQSKFQTPGSTPSSGPPVTVFVGNIFGPDRMMKMLLQKCGKVLGWKRAKGASNTLEAFGFCTYRSPLDGLRAIRILHDRTIGNSNLVVKVDAKTQAQIDRFMSARETNAVIEELMRQEDIEARSGVDEVILEFEPELVRMYLNEKKPKEKGEADRQEKSRKGARNSKGESNTGQNRKNKRKKDMPQNDNKRQKQPQSNLNFNQTGYDFTTQVQSGQQLDSYLASYQRQQLERLRLQDEGLYQEELTRQAVVLMLQQDSTDSPTISDVLKQLLITTYLTPKANQ